MSPSDTETSWFDTNPWKARLILLLFVLLLLESAVRLLVGLGVLTHRLHPTSPEPQFWAYIDPVVGIWKHPRQEFRHRTGCFDLVYRTNSAGMRDVERSLESDAARRVLVLGDSFVEGFGVADGERFTDRLEAETGVEHLNFGASGSFSVVQEWLLYEAYAQKYQHSEVMLFVLPSNDYTDNRPETFNPAYYRPFLSRDKGDFKVWYPVEFDERDTGTRSTANLVKNAIDNHFYLSNQIRVNLLAWGDRPDEEPQSDYDKFEGDDLDALLYALNEVSEIAGERPVTVFTIPSTRDLRWASEHGTDFELSAALEKLATERENIRFHDLTPDFLAYAEAHDLAFEDFTLGCDPHWGPLGHAVAADAVRKVTFTDMPTP